MDQLENLVRLEEAIDKLLRSQQELQEEKRQLQEQLAKQEQEADELRNKLEGAHGEREKILKRVAGLIDSIEKWEKSAGAKVAEVSGAKSGEGKTLF